MRTRHHRGFTLLEQIIVIAIIVTLAALIFAAFGPARERARERTCVSNLHQWGTAFAMYMADYDGIEPVKGVPMKLEQLGLPTGQALFAFDKQYKLFSTPVAYCPSTHYPTAKEANRRRGTSYYVNIEADSDDVAKLIARDGPEYGLMVCDMHNANRDFRNQPTWATKRVVVLRLNQQVAIKTSPVENGSMGE